MSKETIGMQALAERVADELLTTDFGKAQRIAFKGGTWPDNETSLGGLCRSALVDRLRDILAESVAELMGEEINGQ